MQALRTILAVLAIASFLPAQVTTIPGSGCPRSGMICKYGGVPSLCQQVVFMCGHFSVPNHPTFLMICL